MLLSLQQQQQKYEHLKVEGAVEATEWRVQEGGLFELTK